MTKCAVSFLVQPVTCPQRKVQGTYYMHASDFQSPCNCINSEGRFDWNAHVVRHA